MFVYGVHSYEAERLLVEYKVVGFSPAALASSKFLKLFFLLDTSVKTFNAANFSQPWWFSHPTHSRLVPGTIGVGRGFYHFLTYSSSILHAS